MFLLYCLFFFLKEELSVNFCPIKYNAKNVYNFELVLFCQYLYFLMDASKGGQANS